MQRRVQIIIRGIPVGVPVSANGLSQCIENVYHVRGKKPPQKAAAHTGRTQFGSLLAVIELLVLLSLSRWTQVLM